MPNTCARRDTQYGNVDQSIEQERRIPNLRLTGKDAHVKITTSSKVASGSWSRNTSSAAWRYWAGTGEDET